MIDDEIVILGLGGNVGDDAAILARFAAVVRALEVWSTVRASRVYRTAAQGPDQAGYLNAALAVEPPEELKATELIREVLAIEHALGRRRADETRWGPRPIDVDVLLWGTRTIALGGRTPLEVPHPRLHARRFALVPVIELVGADAVLPSGTRTLGALAAAVADQIVEPTAYTIDGAVTVGAVAVSAG